MSNLPARPTAQVPAHLPSHVQRGLVRAYEQMEFAAETAKKAMDEITDTHLYAEWKVAQTAAAVQDLRAMQEPPAPVEPAHGHRLSRLGIPTEQAHRHHRDTAYLLAMGQLVQHHDAAIVDLARDASIPEQSLAEWLLGR